ncbi:RidA family protein [Saccharopolyspora spinosa]|uniref:2-iminobutanoate/2-iminopropanoate deaminase n=1 Tax=Saccharopolyspora spinosa TaxID=60894 RepID=A0A2N3Y6J5_SACSN|nr:RidA family protein [Saccharopolyspora spinosa]PKW18503.1 2-iminobutanoate/2-iminopropanoate deaminase [Saccharopolyspora spinosa]
MSRQAFTDVDLPPAGGPYSAAVRIGNIVAIAGQCGYLADRSLAPGGLEPQVRRAFENLMTALRSAGCSEADVITVNVFLADGDDFDAMNAIYREYFSEPGPARTTITAGLRPGVLFEVSAQAVVGG